MPGLRRFVPSDACQSHGGVTRIQYLELMVFITRIEYQVLVVLPLQTLVGDIIWRDVHLHVVLPSVLHHKRLYLLVGSCHPESVEFHRHPYLLVSAVQVQVCVCGDAQSYQHDGFCNAQFHHKDFLFAVIINDVQPVVTTHAQVGVLVGKLQLVVGVEDCGVDRVIILLYRLVVKPFQPVALKESLCRCPVGIAGFHAVNKAVVVVRQFIKADAQHVLPM